MSAIPAGSAEIEIRGKLEALKADLVQAEAEWAKHETKVTKSAAQAAKERVAAIKAALKEQERALAQTLAAQERAQRDADAAAARSAKEAAKAQAAAAREASQARIAEEKRVAQEVAAQERAIAQARKDADRAAADVARGISKSAAEQQDLLNRAIRLTSEYDVEYGAQLRLNRALSEANTLREKGIIDEQRQAAIAKNAQLQYDKFVKSQQSSKAGGLAQHQLTNLSFQANDVITGILSGQPLGQIAAQQGGQIFQILQTSAGGFAGALKGLLTPLNLSIAGVAGLGVAAGVVALQMHKGAEEAIKFGNNLKIFGDASGISRGQLYQTAESISRSVEVTQGSVKDLELAMVQTGKVGYESFQSLALGSTLLAKATGGTAVDAFNTFKPLLGDTTQAALDLNQQFHFLTLEQLKQVEALQTTGDKQAAVNLVMEAFNKKAKEQEENIGALEKLWRTWKLGIDAVAESLANIGKTSVATDEEKNIERFNKQLKEVELLERKRAQTMNGTVSGRGAFTASDQKRLDASREELNNTRQMIVQDRQRNQEAADRQKSDEAAADISFSLVKNGAKIRELEAQKAVLVERNARGWGDIAAQQKQIAEIDKQIEKAKKPDAVPGAGRLASLAREKAALAENIASTWALADAYTQGGAEGIKAESDRQAAVDATRRGIDLATRQQMQFNLTVAQGAAQAAKTTDDINAQTETLRDRNDQVERGALSIAEANKEQEINNQLREYELLYDKASGDEKERLRLKIVALNAALHAQNEEQIRQATIDSTDRQKRENELLQLQIDLIGKSNRERAVAIAQKQAEMDLDARGEHDPKRRQDAIDAARAGANLGTTQDFRNSDQANRNAGISTADQFAFDAGKRQKDLAEQYEAASQRIQEIENERVIAAQGNEEKITEAHRKAAQEQAQVDAEYQNKRLQSTADFFGSLAQLTQSSNTKLHEIGKAAAIIQATISTYQAINAALASAPFPYNIPAVAMATVTGFANVAAIEGLATGGIVTGSGGPTEDNQLRRLSVGEGVITAKGVRANPGLVEHINAGGTVASSVMVPAGSAASSRAANYNMPAPPQRVQVEVAVRNDGTLQAYVDQRATDISAKTVKTFSTNALPQRQTQIGRQPRVRGGKR